MGKHRDQQPKQKTKGADSAVAPLETGLKGSFVRTRRAAGVHVSPTIDVIWKKHVCFLGTKPASLISLRTCWL